MPGLSGSDVAYKLAVANVARADTTRSGYFHRDVTPVLFGGTARAGTIQASIRIDLNTGNEPHTASFDFKGGGGFIPKAGQTVSIGHGTSANKLFAGRMLKVSRSVARNADTKPTYRCTAAGWLFDIDQSRVFPGVAVQSLAPRSLVPYLLLQTSPNVTSLGFTARNIAAALPRVAEFSTGPAERISTALGRLFKGLDATWYLDHDGDIHAFQGVNSLPTIPTTLTSATSLVWGVDYSPTDFSRVFTRVHVFGASQPTLADVNLTTNATVPIATSSIISNYVGVDADVLSGSTEQYLLGNQLHIGSLIYRPEQSFEPGVIASTFLDTVAGASTLVAVSKNVSSVRPFEAPRWYGIAGQYVYCSSVIGIYSATAGSIAYGYAVPATGPGALTSDIPNASEVAGLFNLVVTSAPIANRFVPAGTPLRVMATRVNSAGVDYIGSLTGSAPYGLISQSYEDDRLSVDGAVDVALSALERGDPSTWQSLTFSTRAREYEIGGPVFVSMTSPAESGGASVTGAFTAHDVTLSGFDQLTHTKGPIRTVIAGTVRRPTFWQVLQGE